MNIVLYVNSFLPVLGGKEFVVHHLANALVRLGHRARVVGPAGFWKHRKQRLAYPVHRWPSLHGRLKEHVAVTQLMLDTALWGCDIVHAHTTYPNGYAAVGLKRARNLPLVITPHGADIQSIPEIGHGRRLDPVLNRKIMHAVQRAELVTAISRNVEVGLLDAGADQARIRPIPNGVDLERFMRPESSRLRIRNWLGVEPDARLIVTIGRYSSRKGQDYIVRAMPAILRAEPMTRLVIVGNGTDELKPLIAEMGLEGKVVLTGGITPTPEILVRTGPPREEDEDPLADLLCSSELYVSAGIQNNAEGLSLAVLESMAAGLPIVATAISGNTDVVTHGVNGFLVEPASESGLADAIVEVLRQPGVQGGMREKSRETAAKYAWVNIARQYLDVYQEAIALARK